MITVSHKRLIIGLMVLLVLTAAAGASLLWELTWLQVRTAFAAEQTEIFEEMRTKALRLGPSQSAECLEYAVNYYPSGSKQEVGSRLDQIVERQRTSAVRDIIAHLRSKTGQDFGDDPQAWIKKFAGK